MIRLAPLITADVDTTTLPGGKASDAAQDFLALLSEALAGETTTDKAAPQLLVATDKPTTKGEPLVSEILADAQQADLLIPVDETPPVINDEQSTSTPLTTAQTMTLAAVAGNNTAKDEKADDLNEDVTASLSALFAMLPGFDNTPKVTDVPSTVLPAEKPTLFTAYIEDVDALAQAGADIIAIDGTDRPRPVPVETLLARIHHHGLLAMTDCSTPEDGLACQKLGAEIIGTTLSGYTTPETPEEPDLALVKTLSDAGCRVIAEGRYNTPAQAADAMRHGAWAVTVGSAITRLEHICQWYNTAMKKAVL